MYGDLDTTKRSVNELNSGGRAYRAALPSYMLGIPVERPTEPVLCLQEARVHKNAHRGSRRVRGGGATIWQRLSALTPHNPVWPGAFKPTAIVKPDIAGAVEDVLRLAFASPVDAARELASLQRDHSTSTVDVVFVRLGASDSAASDPTIDGVRFSTVEGARAMGAAVVLPYCFSCSRKLRLAPLRGSPADVRPVPAQHAVRGSASDSPSGSGVAFDCSESVAADVGYGEWLLAALHEVTLLLPGVGAAALADSPRAATPATRESQRASAAAHRAPGGVVDAAAGPGPVDTLRQCVPLGVCEPCAKHFAQVLAAPAAVAAADVASTPPGDVANPGPTRETL